MATRSTIAIQNADGSIDQVYCHWDGYLSHNGAILQTYYNTREQVEKLVRGGGISVLRQTISDEPLSFDDHDSDCTIFYSYRGERVQVNHFASFEDYERHHQYEEFEYLFTQDDVWSVLYCDDNDVEDWHDLEFELTEQKIVDPFAEKASETA